MVYIDQWCCSTQHLYTFPVNPLMRLWQHILCGCQVCDWGLQYHLCSTYRGLWGLVVVWLLWLSGRVLAVMCLPAFHFQWNILTISSQWQRTHFERSSWKRILAAHLASFSWIKRSPMLCSITTTTPYHKFHCSPQCTVFSHPNWKTSCDSFI